MRYAHVLKHGHTAQKNALFLRLIQVILQMIGNTQHA